MEMANASFTVTHSHGNDQPLEFSLQKDATMKREIFEVALLQQGYSHVIYGNVSTIRYGNYPFFSFMLYQLRCVKSSVSRNASPMSVYSLNKYVKRNTVNTGDGECLSF